MPPGRSLRLGGWEVRRPSGLPLRQWGPPPTQSPTPLVPQSPIAFAGLLGNHQMALGTAPDDRPDGPPLDSGQVDRRSAEVRMMCQAFWMCSSVVLRLPMAR